MAARNIYVYENGKKIRNTAQETIDFLSIKVGASAIEIKESATATGHFDLGAKRLTNVADPVNDQDAATKKYTTDTFIPLTQRAANNGVATLDAGGKVPVAQLPNSVMEYKGAFNPNSGALSTIATSASVIFPGNMLWYSTVAGVVGNDLSVSYVHGAGIGATPTFVLTNGGLNLQVNIEAGTTTNNNIYTEWQLVSGSISAVFSLNSSSMQGGITPAASGPTALTGGAAAPNLGDVYRANTAGTMNAVLYGVGDFAIFNGTIWEHSPAADAVTSVNGQQGVVSLDTDDVSEGTTNLYYTDARAKAATVADSITDAITDVAPSQNAVFDALALKADDSVVVKTVNGQSPTAGAVTITTTNITEGTNLYYTDARAKAAAVSDAIVDGVTDVAPSQNAVFDALALKANSSDDFEICVNDNASTITVGQIVYLKTNGHVDLAKADAIATCSSKLGIVIDASIATTASGKIHFLEGKPVDAYGSYAALTVGVMYYLSAATAGAITPTAPSTVTNCIVPLGKTTTTAKLAFNPEEVVEILS